MLYDPKWETEVKADPFSLESLIAWLEKQPVDKVYDFNDCGGGCLLEQYAAAMGIPDECGRYGKLDDLFDRGVSPRHRPAIAVQKPWTFGAALARAKAVQAQP